MSKVDTDELKKKIRHRKKIPVRKLYISDLHFYHDSLNHRMDLCGFSGYEEMNDHMVKQWNDHVTKKDEVYILGDFAISRGSVSFLKSFTYIPFEDIQSLYKNSHMLKS